MSNDHEWTDPTPPPVITILPDDVSPTRVWAMAAVIGFVGVPLVSLGIMMLAFRWIF